MAKSYKEQALENPFSQPHAAGEKYLDSGKTLVFRPDDNPSKDARRLVERLRAFTDLPADWNGFGGEAMSQDMFRHGYAALIGFDVVRLPFAERFLPADVIASSGGGFAFGWRLPAMRVLLEVEEEGWEWSIQTAKQTVYGEYSRVLGEPVSEAIAAFLSDVKAA